MLNEIDKIMTIYGDYIILGIIALIIIIVFFKRIEKRIRKIAYVGIPKAEDGSIINHLKPTLYKWVDDFDKKDYDQRMVEVIAYIIQCLPVLKIIPRSIVIKYVSAIVQSVFNNLKASLDVQRRPNHVKITEDLVRSTLTTDNKIDQEKYTDKLTTILRRVLENVEIMDATKKLDQDKVDYIKEQIKKAIG